MEADRVALEELRKEFPAGTVGVLPKPYKRTSPKGTCKECGGYHGLPAVHLDFVGHAAVTDRLLTVDPEWNWEPLALDERGLPALDRDGNLWIRLTVAGVTRIGVGTGTSMKERIGDALRNAAMRFGVALSLWTKDELESGHAEAKATTQTAPAPIQTEHAVEDAFPGAEPVDDYPPTPTEGKPAVNERMNKRLYALCAANHLTSKEEASRILGRRISTTKNLPARLTKQVMDQLDAEGVKFPD